MKMKTRMPFEPPLERWTLMGSVVIHDEVQVQLSGGLAINLVQKADKLPAAMPWQALANDLAVQQAQGCKQSGCAVPRVIVGLASGNPRTQRQQGCSSVQGLNLTLFIDR
jgi:hypothetical protein